MRSTLYDRLDDCDKDFNILKNRLNCFMDEMGSSVKKLDKSSDSLIILDSENAHSYGAYALKDIVQDIGFLEKEIDIILKNKESRLTSELYDHIEDIEDRLRVIANRFKQLNVDIKDVYCLESIIKRAR